MSRSDLYISRFENKGDPVEAKDTKIVEAFGLGKCPKLVLQIAGSDLEVRINALAVLCEEFKNPYSVVGCAKEGIVKVLAKLVNHPDYTTRVSSTCALALAAKDCNGAVAILYDDVIPQILAGVEDPSAVVRGHVYECLYHLSKTANGVESCVRFGVTRAFASVLRNEEDHLKIVILRALANIANQEQGLIDAIEADVVRACIDLLNKSIAREGEEPYSSYEPSIIAEAAKTLGFMSFDGRARTQALSCGAIQTLILLLKKPDLLVESKSSVTLAISSITITDEGKIQVFTYEGVDTIIALLYDSSRVVLLNSLKILSNISVYPKNREILLTDATCVAKLRKLSKYEDALIAKHAALTLKAVNWNP